jgi:hypothetical protein
MPFLAVRPPLSGVVGGEVAVFPPPSPQRRALAREAARCSPSLSSLVGGHQDNGASSVAFCAEKVPKRYMFGTDLAVNI